MAESDELELTASRVLPYPPDRVWSACTRKESLERWWSPEDLRTIVRKLELRPGGDVDLYVRYVPALLTSESADAFRAARIPISFHLRGRVSELEPERALGLDLTLEIDRAGAGVKTVTRLEFTPEGSGTRVDLIARGKGTPHWATLGTQNLEAQLERLEHALAHSPESR